MTTPRQSFSRKTSDNDLYNLNYRNDNNNKSQIASSFLSFIECERRNRNEYEDLDKIQEIKSTTPPPVVSTTTATTTTTTRTYGTSNDNLIGHFLPGNSSTSYKEKNSIQRNSNEITEEIEEENQNLCRINADILFLIYSCFYIIFLIIGGFVFHHLEAPMENKIREKFLQSKIDFLQKYPQISETDLVEFLNQAIEIGKRGILPIHETHNESNWNFEQALFFSSTIVTTIGYGHITPLSQVGKIFCMIYAAIGIPLTMIFLNAAVERLIIPAKWFFGLLDNKFGHICETYNIYMLHFSVIALFIGLFFFVIPTAVFNYLEPSWSVLDSFYFCFISMTTIGLGDYVPGQGGTTENKSAYKIYTTIYLITGLIAVMLGSKLLNDIPYINLTQPFTKNKDEQQKLLLGKNQLNKSNLTQSNISLLSDETIVALDKQPTSLHQYTRIH